MNQFLLATLLLLAVLKSQGQHVLQGTVTSNNENVPGATIRLVGTGHASVTGLDGHFQIKNIASGVYTAEVRCMGLATQRKEINIPSPSPLSFVLQESALTTGEIVVTGTMQPTYVSDSPVKIDVVTSTHIDTYLPTAATGLIEGITLVNGVQEVVACGVCFTNSISINGLPGPYTAVLMDGTPIYGNLASVYGLNGIPSMLIDRFEVIKGPSSTLYGSEAVAGVINIITKDPHEQPGLSLDVMGTSHAEAFTNVSGKITTGKSVGFIGLNHAYINDFDDENNDQFGDGINLDRISLFTKWDLHRKSGRMWSLAGKLYYEDRRNGVQEFLENRAYRQLRGDEDIYGESIYTHRAELFGTYALNPGWKVDYSVSTHSQDSYYGADHYKAAQNILFSNLIHSRSLGKHDALVGLTSRVQYYQDNTIATAQDEDLWNYTPGIFIQDDWRLNKQWQLLLGGRLDYYEAHGLIGSPRLSIKHKPGDWSTFRINTGTGFRIVNLFTEDHAFVTGQREVVIEKPLSPEESYNVSLNFNHLYTFRKAQGTLDIDAYYTYFTNKITPDYSDAARITYRNSPGHAISRGIGANIQNQFQFPVSFNAGINFQQVFEVSDEMQLKIPFAPFVTGVFNLNYKPRKAPITIAYSTNYTGKMALPEVYDVQQEDNNTVSATRRPIRSVPYSLHNVQVSYKVGKSWSTYGGIQNLLDYRQPWSPLIGFDDPGASPGFSDRFDTSYAYSTIHGREFYIGIKWSTGR